MITAKAILFNVISMVCLVAAARVTNIDSLDQVLKTSKDDTAKVNLLIKTGQKQMYTLPGKALDYCQQAIALSKKISYPLGLANAYRLQGSIYEIKGESETAIIRYYQLADSIYHKYNGRSFKEGIGSILHNYGAIQHRKGNYLGAMQFYIKASKILDSLDNKTLLPKTYNNLSHVYDILKQYDKAVFYAKECVRLAEETKDMHLISAGSIALAIALIDQKKYEEALVNILKAKKIAESRNDHYILGLCYLNTGIYYNLYKKDYVQAASNSEKALEHIKLLGNQWEEARIAIFLSTFYFNNKQFEKSKTNALKAYELSHALKLSDIEQSSHFSIAQNEAYAGNYKTAYDHLLQSSNLKDTVFKEENQRQINYLEALYQSEKKEKEINQLQSEKQISALTIKKRNILIDALFVTMALLVGIAFLINRNIRNKRVIVEKDNELQKHKIHQLESEKMLLATQSVLLGEENERKRLAGDLHDGLGGLLSGVKLALNNMKGNVVLNSESVDVFNQALGMLDTSITELRRVAHNMMPEALAKAGLRDTLSYFCSELDKVNPMSIIFQFVGQFARVDSNLEINVYRIIQELVNNAIKHSEAKELVVQMIQEPNRLCFVVLDNGKGLDIKEIEQTKGVGLASVKSRVNSFQGRMEINSKPLKGTEITIEFSI